MLKAEYLRLYILFQNRFLNKCRKFENTYLQNSSPQKTKYKTLCKRFKEIDVAKVITLYLINKWFCKNFNFHPH